MIGHAAILSPQGRLRSLLSAHRSIVGELSLPAVLRQIVMVAKETSGARYAALGVIGADGQLEQFINVGMDTADAARIGPLPVGLGVLGALTTDGTPIRLSDITDDPRSCGLPPGHPPMSSFLGVPIRIRDTVYGNLYLTDRVDGRDFDAEDEELVLALAATAGIAIENARLYAESRLQQEWLRASGEVSRELMTPDADEMLVLQRIAVSVLRLAGADLVAIVFTASDPDELEVAVAAGAGMTTLPGQRYAQLGSAAGRAMSSQRGVLDDAADPTLPVYRRFAPTLAIGPVMALPLIGSPTRHGAIVVARSTGRPSFGSADLEMAETFAGHATVGLELADARRAQQRLMTLEDRHRIARDLHDHVIQRLFATGLSVQSATPRVTDLGVQALLTRTVSDIDDTISQIRTSIFALQEPVRGGYSLRAAVLTVVEQVSSQREVTPEVLFEGPVDTVVCPEIASDVEAVVREALTNVSRHAHARSTALHLRVRDAQLSVTLTNDGATVTGGDRESGLANLRWRATRHGGHLVTALDADGVFRLVWTVPLTP